MHNYKITHASVYDSQVFEELLDKNIENTGIQRTVCADSAYRSKGKEDQLSAEGILSQICEKGTRNHQQTEEWKISNKNKPKVHFRGEHIFGII